MKYEDSPFPNARTQRLAMPWIPSSNYNHVRTRENATRIHTRWTFKPFYHSHLQGGWVTMECAGNLRVQEKILLRLIFIDRLQSSFRKRHSCTRSTEPIMEKFFSRGWHGISCTSSSTRDKYESVSPLTSEHQLATQ